MEENGAKFSRMKIKWLGPNNRAVFASRNIKAGE
jgi:hypothetical protein